MAAKACTARLIDTGERAGRGRVARDAAGVLSSSHGHPTWADSRGVTSTTFRSSSDGTPRAIFIFASVILKLYSCCIPTGGREGEGWRGWRGRGGGGGGWGARGVTERNQRKGGVHMEHLQAQCTSPHTHTPHEHPLTMNPSHT